MRFLTFVLAYGLLFAGLVNLASALPASGQEILTYESPDGSVGFTDDPGRVPPAAIPTLKVAKPTDARWTRVERSAVPHQWYVPQPSYEAREAARHWQGQAEAARRNTEDAETIRDLADELGVGRRAAARNLRNQLDREARLEERCRVSGTCRPGDLR